MKIRTSLPIILSVVTVIALSAVATGAYAQRRPLFDTGDMYVRGLSITAYAGEGLPTTFSRQGLVLFPAIRGQGIAFDAAGNLYVGTGTRGGEVGLEIYPCDLDFDNPKPIGKVVVPPPGHGVHYLALRPPDQVFACHTLRPGELLVFGTEDPRNPTLDYRWPIPGVEGQPCGVIAFDRKGHLWVTSFVRLIKLTLNPLTGEPTLSASFIPVGGLSGLAFEPKTERLFYGGSNFVAVVDPEAPLVRIATITNVCDFAGGNPGDLVFDSSGNLYVGCRVTATHQEPEVVVFSAALLGVNLAGTKDAKDLLGVFRLVDKDPRVGAAFIAFKPSKASPCPIPTVSEWGMVVMTLLLLTAGKIYFARRRVAH